MHRSGTSAVGRLLSLLGADLPTQTIGPDEFNPSGYWEAPELYRLHDQMLARAGSRWDDWRPFQPASLDIYDRVGLEHAFLQFLDREFHDSKLFVIKDPRICRFVPIWLDVFGNFSAAPGIIIPVRHPFAVAQSLEKRDGFSLAKSAMIWLRHVVDAEYATRHVPRSFVDYDRLLTDWRTQVDRIAHEIGIAWPQRLPDVAEEIDRFLSVRLRHHVATVGSLDESTGVVSWVRRAYAAVQALARAGDHEAARRDLDQVRAEFDNACLAFGDLWREERSHVAQESLAELGVVSKQSLDRQIQQFERRCSALDAGMRESSARMNAVDMTVSGLQRAAEQQQRALNSVQSQSEEARSHLEALRQTTIELSNRLEAVATLGARRDAAIEHIETTAEAHRADVTRQLAQLTEQALRRDATVEGLAAAHGERFAELAVELRQITDRVASRDATADAVVATHERRQSELLQRIDTQARTIDALEKAVAASARQSDNHVETARHVDAHEARLARMQYSLDGAIARLDAITARAGASRKGSWTKGVKERLRGAGRRIERAVRKVRKEFGRVIRLQTLRNYLARRRFRRVVRTIRSSGLFDAAWYLREYQDVAATGIDPVLHYLEYGVREGRCPNPLFHTRWYLDQYPDVAAEKADPLLHYLDHGAAEGRDPSPLFQTAAWVARHPELRRSKQNPLAHYLSQIDTSPHGTALPSTGDSANASVLPLCPAPILTTPTLIGEARPEPFAYAPLVSIVVPIYNTPADLLEQMVASVKRQAYENWELCLVDDASPQPHVRPRLEQMAAHDPRIRVTFRASNGNISAATNTGIAVARGEFIAFLDHDDELTPDALLEVVRMLNDEPDTDVVYTDQDKIDLAGRRSEPFYKPAWSPAYLESVMYVGHLLVVRASILREVGGCDGTFDGVQDFELMLRLGEATKKIRHLPKILYHWRMIPGSIASDVSAKKGIVDLQRQAVQAHLDRLGLKAVATTSGNAHRVRVVPAARSHEPLVSIMIPSKDHPELIGPCLASLFEKTTYKTFEVIVGDNETSDPEALRLFERYPVTRVPLPGKFCFAAFNNRMAEKARGDYLLLLNNDTEVVQPDWLETLMLYAEQNDVGAVGPMLLYGDGTVQHAGVILGPRGTADHVMRGFPGDSDGYAGSLQAAREVTAVTGACLLVRREHFMACGGLNETFGRHYEDVDFCLRLRRLGLRNIFVGGARMVHHESKSRGSYYDFTDRVLLLDHWESWIQRGDPYYNPSFDPERVDYSVRVA
jgi:GT2 family glycosyltransferase